MVDTCTCIDIILYSMLFIEQNRKVKFNTSGGVFVLLFCFLYKVKSMLKVVISKCHAFIIAIFDLFSSSSGTASESHT